MKFMELRVILRVTAGECGEVRRELVWGKPVAPFSVGTRGDWAVEAPGVEAIHLFFAFDGHRLHAAAASPDHSVLVQGMPLGPEWTHLAVPSLIAFGGASIAVDCEDGAASHTAIRPRPIVDLSRADQQPTEVMDLSQTLQLRTVRLELSERMLSELREAPAESAESSPRSGTPGRQYLQSGDTLSFQPAPVATLAFPLPPNLVPQARAQDLANTLYDGGALRERARELAATLEPSKDSVVPVARSREPELRKPGVFRRSFGAFRRRSSIQQLTIALFPLAVAGVWLMKDGAAAASAEPSPRHVVRPSASTAAPPPSALSAPPSTAIAVSSSAVAAVPTGVELPGPPNDPSERLALLAAFNGNKEEAVQLYERLAQTRHSRTFALAARFTREDRVRKP